MDAASFEREMKLLKYNIEIKSPKFCIVASEYLDADWVINVGNLNSCVHIEFHKCINELKVTSDDIDFHSSIIQFSKELQPYFDIKRDEVSYYSVDYKGAAYSIILERDYFTPYLYTECLRIKQY
jgi:hypothetical protein